MSKFASDWLNWEKNSDTPTQRTDKTDRSRKWVKVAEWEAIFGHEPCQPQPVPTPREPWKLDGWYFSVAHGGVIAKHLENGFEVYWPLKKNPNIQNCDQGHLVRKAEQAYERHNAGKPGVTFLSNTPSRCMPVPLIQRFKRPMR